MAISSGRLIAMPTPAILVQPPADLSELDQRLGASTHPLIDFRTFLKDGRERLWAQFDAGVPITAVVTAYAGLVDELLKRVWRLWLPNCNACALIAVGGYGRGELHPGSDIDILILLGDQNAVIQAGDALGNFITFLFDMGLQPGYSVRTVAECVSEAKQDITVITNLLEARLLAGPEVLLQYLNVAIAPDGIWPSDAFFAAKWQEQQARWERFGSTAYNLEPNIKENPGGLRDIQMIGWVCRRHFGTRTLHELVERGFLTESEYCTLMDGQTLLWQIRFALHRLAGRREDRLLFDYQRTLAHRFGYQDQEHNLAVEQFMQRYYRTITELNRLNDMLMQLFQEVIILKCHLDPPTPISSRFQSRNGYLETVHARIFEYYPIALLEVFFLLQTHTELQGVRASTIRQIRAHLARIDDNLRRDLRARSLFMEMLRQPEGITTSLRRMNRYGVLAAYIPSFHNIVGRMQYDLFHVYTVDAHTLFVLRNLRRFAIAKHSHEFPLCSAIAQTIPKLELLYLAGLFHDIAKGRGGDHSVLGAQEAWNFCQTHVLSDYDSRLVSWLVEKHLLMSMTAQREDISDSAVIQAFAAIMGDTTRLDYLYLLTVADSRATNPARWNTWKNTLLKDLYQATRNALLRGLDNPQAQHLLAQQKQNEALRLLQLHDQPWTAAPALWNELSSDFFLHNSPAEIAWQTQVVLTTPNNLLPQVAIRPETERGCTEVFLYTQDRDGLFAWSAALLTQLCLSIVDARIMTTTAGKALNLYLVLEENGLTVGEDIQRQNEIIRVLSQGLNYKAGAEPRVWQRTPRQIRHFDTKTQISFTQDPVKQRTLLRLVTRDRPGLLADVGQVFSACQLRLHNAKIATLGAAVEDIFFITTRQNQPVTDPLQLDTVRDQLLKRLNAP